MATQISAHGHTYWVESDGFRGHDAARDKAVNLVEAALYHMGPERCATLTDDEMISIGASAARDATADWACWLNRDAVGPMLMVSRVEG